MQAGTVVEEGSHEELWSNSETVYHSLVALQEAATDRRDHLTAVDLEEIVKKDAELAEEAAAEAAKEASQQNSLKVRVESKGGDLASKKSLTSEKKLSGGGEEEEEEALVRTVFSRNSLSPCPLRSRLRSELPPHFLAFELSVHAFCVVLHTMYQANLSLFSIPSYHRGDRVQTEEEKNTKVGFMRLLSMNKKEWPYIILGIVSAAGVGCIMPLFAVILSSLIAALRPEEPSSEILRFCILFWCLGAAHFILASVQVRTLRLWKYLLQQTIYVPSSSL